MNTLYPIFLKVEQKPVLVIGGGKIAEQKVSGLLEVNATVTVIAPKLTTRLETLSGAGNIFVQKREYRRGDVEGFTLVFASTNNPAVHKEIFDEAISQNIPVNVVDVPDLCNFYLASVFRNGDLKVAVSTNGKSPTLGKIIRDRIAAEFGKGYPELLDTLGDIRPYVHSAYAKTEKRKEVLERIVDEELKKKLLSRSALTSTHPYSGKVILVGAGPGDPDLISVKGLHAIQQADVIAYDALVSPDLLLSARPECENIFVGKRSNGHFALQEEINGVLISRAKAGKNVVRLKGGDPFVFGRGGEELLALREEGVEVEIIPGITAGIGIPSSLGIPLTHRGIASNVVLVTGSEISDKENSVDWSNISAIDTIVVYMGIKKLPEIVTKLTNSGRNNEAPVAVIFGGTTTDQIVIKGTLSTIVENVQTAKTDAPGIIIIGDVVDAFSVQKKFDAKELLQ
ncbi:MAG: uroporphyrinogen-III C-methyltransferase [Ignavibacteriales bacterium]|nr:uroporphyrinogen-III C-methyltransferase [Ignavibacteriales bacterium]